MNFPAIRRIPEGLTRLGGTYEAPTLPWEIDKAVVTGSELDISAKDAAILELDISVGGQELFALGNVTDTIYQYTLCTEYDLSTAQYTDSHSFAAQTGIGISFKFFQSGTMLLVADTAGLVYVYTLTTGWDLSTVAA
jgi:hypothetical protein